MRSRPEGAYEPHPEWGVPLSGNGAAFFDLPHFETGKNDSWGAAAAFQARVGTIYVGLDQLVLRQAVF